MHDQHIQSIHRLKNNRVSCYNQAMQPASSENENPETSQLPSDPVAAPVTSTNPDQPSVKNTADQQTPRTGASFVYDWFSALALFTVIIAVLLIWTIKIQDIYPNVQDNSLFMSVQNIVVPFAAMFIYFGGFLFMIPIVLYGIIYGHMRARDVRSVIQLIVFYLCAIVLAAVMLWLQSLPEDTRF